MVPQDIRNVTIIGVGTLGFQIAVQAVHHGFSVSVYDPAPGALARAAETTRVRIENSGRRPKPAFTHIDRTAGKIVTCASLQEAVRNADLVVEAVPENLFLKRTVFAAIDAAARPYAILATNSSSLPVSKIESATARPDKCLNIHFYGMDIKQAMADVMGGTCTSRETFDRAVEWVRAVGGVPLLVCKESIGFCFNRVWRSVKRETLEMWADGITDFRDIDRGWMIYTGMSAGPFGIMDSIGLDVVYDIETIYHSESNDPKDRPPERLKALIDRNELGVKTGKGFYTYPDPEYRRSDFIQT